MLKIFFKALISDAIKTFYLSGLDEMFIENNKLSKK